MKKEKVRRLSVVIDDNTMDRLKVRAAKDKKAIKKIVVALIVMYLNNQIKKGI